jgi:hypothetical protein
MRLGLVNSVDLFPSSESKPFVKGEIVGLRYTTDGRTCEANPNGCGIELKANDIVRFVDN